MKTYSVSVLSAVAMILFNAWASGPDSPLQGNTIVVVIAFGVFVVAACIVLVLFIREGADWMDTKIRKEVPVFGKRERRYIALVLGTGLLLVMMDNALRERQNFAIAERVAGVKDCSLSAVPLLPGMKHGDIAYYGMRVGNRKVLVVATANPLIAYVSAENNKQLTAVYPAVKKEGCFPSIEPDAKPRKPTWKEKEQYAQVCETVGLE